MTKKNPAKPEPLALSIRGNTIETLHYGWICILDKDKNIIYKKGNVNEQILLRSCAKPIQAIPLVKHNIKITGKELAIVCGSHSGSKKHLKVLYGFMKTYGLYLSDLQCGIHLPYDEKEKNNLIINNLHANPLHNNCSGKHLGMLVVCKKNNWDLKNYLDLKHPLQKLILKTIEGLSETKKISIGIDGCSLPTFGLPVINIAKMFSNFSSDKQYSRIISSMKKNPFYMGSENQIDTEITKKSNGELIAKVGAEGIIVVFNDGNSAVVKIADGSPKARSIVVLKLLLKLGWLKQKEIKHSPLEEIIKGEIKNHRGICTGKIISLISS